MELRRHKHLHFIRAIQGRSIRRVLNVDACGRPGLKFKMLEDIYKKENVESDASLPKIQPRVVKDLPANFGMIKEEGTCQFSAERTIKKESDVYEADCNGIVGESGEMTLKQIRQQCKATKRKRLSYTSEESTKDCSPVKQEYPTVQTEDDESDLEKPLSNWKSKVSKKRKDKKKREEKCPPTSSPIARSANKSELVPSGSELLHCKGNSPASVNIKVEVCEPQYPDCGSVTCASADFPPDCDDEELSPNRMEFVEVPNITNVVEEDSHEYPTSLGESCVINEVSYEFRKNVDHEPALDGSFSGEEITKEDSPEVTDKQDSDPFAPESWDEGYINDSISPGDQALYEHGESSSEFLHCKGNLPAFLHSKVAVREPQYPDCGSVTCASAGFSLDCDDEELSSTGMESVKVPNTTNAVEENIHVCPTSLGESFVINELSHDFRKNVDHEPALDGSVSGKEIAKEDSPEVTDQQGSNPAAPESRDEAYINDNDPFFSNISPGDHALYEHEESVDPKPIFGVDGSGWEIVKVESPEILSLDYSDWAIARFLDDGHLIHELPYDVSPEKDSPTRDSYTQGALQTYPSVDETSSLARQRSQVQEFDLDISHGLSYLSLNSMESSHMPEDITKDDLPTTPEVIAGNPKGNGSSSADINSYSGPESCSISAGENFASVKKESLSPTHVGEARDCISISSYNGSLRLPIFTEEEDDHHKRLHCPPERLFSTRKSISPASQEKLRKAMEYPDSQEKKNNKCKGKLYFSSQNTHRILKAEGLDDIKKVDVTPNSKQINRKTNCLRQGSHQKGPPKISQNIPGAASRFSTGHASIQSCSQHAIAFSQRQMRDIEGIATKLTDELKSMKDIMKGCMQPGDSPSKLSNHDEVRIAMENAARAEETAKKWLSMMERNCNRFCKIMRMVQDSSATPEKIVNNKRRKITFADEAGGDLCHVKVFENNVASPTEFGHEEGLVN